MHKVLYPIVVYLIPLILISVLNLRMLSYIASSRVQSVGHKRRMAKERRSVMLLIAIVLTFFTCHTGKHDAGWVLLATQDLMLTIKGAKAATCMNLGGLVIRFVDHEAYGNMPCFVFSKDFVNFLFNINSFSNPMVRQQGQMPSYSMTFQLYFFFTKQFKDLRVRTEASRYTGPPSTPCLDELDVVTYWFSLATSRC